MKWIKRYIPKIILLDTLLYSVLFLVLCSLLKAFNLMFRQWVGYTSAAVIVLGVIAGIVQLIWICRKNKSKILPLVLLFLILAVVSPVAYFMGMLTYKPEYEVEMDGKSYIAYVNTFFRTRVEYYDAVNGMVAGNQIRIKEDYGGGSFDPIGNPTGYAHKIEETIYYDENGNVARTIYYDKNGNAIE